MFFEIQYFKIDLPLIVYPSFLTFVPTWLTSIYNISFFFYRPSLNHIYASVYNCICTVILRRRRASRVDQDDGNGDNDAVDGNRKVNRSVNTSDLTFLYFSEIQNPFFTCLKSDRNFLVTCLMIEQSRDF